jgi:DNA-binding transcriptional LysR family regulator
MLDPRRLQLLQTVVEAGSLSAAAVDLRYTPSAVSQQIASLEAQAGVRLLIRGPKGVRPTPAGEVLLGHAAAVGRRLADAERDLKRLADLRAGRVRISAFHSAAGTLLPALLQALSTSHPGLEIDVQELDPIDGIARLREGTIDCAVVFSYERRSVHEPGLETSEIAKEPILLALPRGHPSVRANDPVDLRSLADEPWLQCVTPSCARALPQAAFRAGFTPSVRFSSSDYGSLLGFVAAGLGVALIPALATSSLPEGVVLRSVARLKLERRVSALVGPPDARPPALAPMLELLSETGQRLVEAHTLSAMRKG